MSQKRNRRSRDRPATFGQLAALRKKQTKSPVPASTVGRILIFLEFPYDDLKMVMEVKSQRIALALLLPGIFASPAYAADVVCCKSRRGSSGCIVTQGRAHDGFGHPPCK